MKGSGRTLKTGRGQRPWFGRRQAKKATGNAAHQQGDECVEGAGSQRQHPLQSIRGAEGIVYELPKNGGGGVPLAAPRLTHRPFTEKHTNDHVRFSDRSSPSRQNDRCGQQPKKKKGSRVKALIWAFWCRPLVKLCFNHGHQSDIL